MTSAKRSRKLENSPFAGFDVDAGVDAADDDDGVAVAVAGVDVGVAAAMSVLLFEGEAALVGVDGGTAAAAAVVDEVESSDAVTGAVAVSAGVAGGLEAVAASVVVVSLVEGAASF